jgi:hypothetical protein
LEDAGKCGKTLSGVKRGEGNRVRWKCCTKRCVPNGTKGRNSLTLVSAIIHLLTDMEDGSKWCRKQDMGRTGVESTMDINQNAQAETNKASG